MGAQPNKYHISDDGKIYQIKEDGSITEKGQIDVLLSQSATKSKSHINYFLTKNTAWLCVIGGVLLALLISVFAERESCYHIFNLPYLLMVYCDSYSWFYIVTLCCVFVTWFMIKKQIKQKIWIYVVYAIGVLFMADSVYFFDRYVWGEYIYIVECIDYFLPAITLAIWAYALQDNKNK